MSRVFADTFYYLALLNSIDEAHERAAEFTDAFTGMMVTTDLVLVELANGLSGTQNRRALIEFVENHRTDPAVRIVPAGRRLLERGWDLYRRRQDKDWSLTDCTSFIVMQDRGIKDALTGDHHFEQAGFRALLK